MANPSRSSATDGILGIRPSLDWILLSVAIAGIASMIIASSAGGSHADSPVEGPRLAVGLTPSDQAITVVANLCRDEQVAAISLVSVEDGLILWEAIATQPDDRDVFVVGQPPITFAETVPLLTERPRAILLRADVTTTTVYSAEFFFADLLPGLWLFEDTYYPEENISGAMGTPGSCPGSSLPTSPGRRSLMVVGFLAAVGAGAIVVARRIVPSGLD